MQYPSASISILMFLNIVNLLRKSLAQRVPVTGFISALVTKLHEFSVIVLTLYLPQALLFSVFSFAECNDF